MLIYYKSFVAEVNYISRTGCFYGEVIDENYYIIFQSDSKDNLQEAFEIAVEQYLFNKLQNPTIRSYTTTLVEL